MGMRSTTQAFQFDVPFEQLFQLATPAAQSVPKATVTLADPNRQVVTFDTPFGMMSWGEKIVVGFIPSEGSTVVEVTCTTKGLPNLMQDSRNRKLIAQFVTTLSNLAQTTAVEVERSWRPALARLGPGLVHGLTRPGPGLMRTGSADCGGGERTR